MISKMKSDKQFCMKMALLCCGFGVYSDSVITPIVTQLQSEFSDAPSFWVNFVISGSAVIGVFTGLIAAILARRWNHKYILFGSTLLYAVSGVAGSLANSIWFLAVTRAVDSACDGFTLVMTAALISELVTDEAERNNLLGLNWAVSAVFGMIMAFLAGILAVQSWRAAFLVNVLAFIAPIMILLFIPGTQPSAPSEKVQTASAGKKKIPLLWVVLSIGAFFCLNLLSNTLYFYIDVYVVERDLGNSAISGTLAAVNTSGALVAGIAFGKVYQKTRRIFTMLLYLVSALGFAVLFLPVGYLLIAIAVFLIGACSIASTPCYEAESANRVPENQLPMVLGWLNVAQCGGVALAAYVPGLFQGILGIHSTVHIFGIISIAFAILAICHLFPILNNKRSKKL